MRDRHSRRAILVRHRLMVIAHAERSAVGALEGGARLIQLRMKDAPRSEVYETAKRLLAPCEEAGALLIVNDDAAVAMAVGADGVHLGQDDLHPDAAREIVGQDLIVGRSVHDLREGASALLEDVDYVGIGTVFASDLKPDLPARGLDNLRWVVGMMGAVPAFAIGGIHELNVREVLATGVHGVAVGSRISASAHPADRTLAILRAISRAER